MSLGACRKNCASGDIVDFVVHDFDQQLEPERPLTAPKSAACHVLPVIRLRFVSVFANNRFLAATNVLSLVVVELILPMLVSLQVPLSIFSSLPPFPFQPLNSVIEVRRHSSGGHLFEGCD